MTASRYPRPRYVRVGGRHVHLQVLGEGPPLLVLHPSPGSSTGMLGLAERLEGWQVLALDTPGCGRSDPLDDPAPAIADYAGATLEAVEALGLERFSLLGSHTGAKVALELARRVPGRVLGLVLDGLGISTPEERDDQLVRYTPQHPPQGDGSHLVRVWHQVRDMTLFWPWYAHDLEHRMVATPPSAEVIHQTVVDMLRNLDHYQLTYHAAFRHDPLADLAEVSVPTLVLAAAEDPLHEHLSRLPDLDGHVTVDADGGDRAPRILRWLGGIASPTVWSPRDQPLPEAGEWRTYWEADHGPVHVTVRAAAVPKRRPLVALHAAPGSARSLQPLAAGITDRTVILPDIPGLGGSAPVRPGPVEVDDLATGLGAALAPMIGEPVDLYGTHTGAAIALEWTRSETLPSTSALLDGLLLGIDERFRAQLVERYARPLEPDPHGLHLLEAWHRLRDMTLFWPWYDQTARGVRRQGPAPDPELLQPLVTDLLAAATTHHEVYRAAFRYHAKLATADVTVPTLISALPDDPLAAGIGTRTRLSDRVTVEPEALAGGRADQLAVLDALADGSAP